MRLRLMASLAASAVVAAVVGSPTAAASPPIEEVQLHLYDGDSVAAAEALNARLAAFPNDDEARFALGAVQFLQALENVGRLLHRYGLRTGEYRVGVGLMGLPILRIPVPPNPHPEELTYDAMRDVLAAFIDDLSAAEGTLGTVGPSQIDLPMDLGRIRLDLDGDGVGSDEESLLRIYAAVTRMRMPAGDALSLSVDFDQSDVPWLQAYCHVLMAFADFALAYDWEETFDITAPGIFAMPSSPYAQLQEPITEITRLADVIAFIHLNRWRLVDAERMRSVARHFDAMIRLSRASWSSILAETDNGAEWIPNPSQVGIFPEITVSADQAVGWRRVLDELEALLQGRRLLGHWRFEQGLNMRRFFADPPATFDLLMLIHGAGALPYLEDGELTTAETWRAITRPFAGNPFRFFIWFN